MTVCAAFSASHPQTVYNKGYSSWKSEANVWHVYSLKWSAEGDFTAYKNKISFYGSENVGKDDLYLHVMTLIL